MNMDIENKSAIRRPIFGLLSLIVPVCGIALAYWAASTTPPSSGDNWNGLIILGFGGAFSVLCGSGLALVGLLRKEKLCLLSWLGLLLNLIPLLWVLGKAGILPVRLG